MRTVMLRIFAAASAVAALVALVACDPVKSDAVNALGDEAPGVRRGPLHRPGQPCIVCHDGAIGDPQEFSVAGTIYQTQNSTTPADNARVTLTGTDGTSITTTTNAAGNFYLQPREFTPVYPLKVSVTWNGSKVVEMKTRIGRDGSCAFCHTDPAGPTSAGHIFVPADGATP